MSSGEKKSPPSVIVAPDRGKWGNQLQFILSCVGFTIGLGNVWRFPYLVYTNGGGAFLIPYVFAVATSGLPLYALELAIGQYGSLGPTTAYRRMSPGFQGLGWATVIVSFNISMYFNVILAWTILYFFESFRAELPWVGCENAWNTFRCGTILDDAICDQNPNYSDALYFAQQCFNGTEVNDTSRDGTFVLSRISRENVTINVTVYNASLTYGRVSPAEEFYRYYILGSREHPEFIDLLEMNWRLFGCFAAAWLVCFACLSMGIQSSGKVVYFTAIFPYVVFFIMLILGSTLPGAINGVTFYITPNLTKLSFADVWRKAAVQVFYSLGPGEGTLVTLASFNEFHNNFIRDAMMVVAIDAFTSTFAGFTTFTIVGYVAHLLKVPVDKAVTAGPGLIFVVFPQAIATLPGKQFWSALYFMMIITVGLDSEFAMFETVTTAVIDEFPHLTKRKVLVVGCGCLICFLLGLPFCTKGGILAFTIYDDYSSGYVLVLLALYQTVMVSWIYGLDNFLQDIKRMLGKMLNYYWRVAWAVLTPAYMMAIFIATMVLVSPSIVFGRVLPDAAQQLGWLLSAIPMLTILAFFIYRVVEVKQKALPWKSLVVKTPHWCPALELAKRSPARHEGSARLHLLDHPYQPHKDADDKEPSVMTASSKLKSSAAKTGGLEEDL